MNCQNCNKNLPDFPKESVESDTKGLEQVVAHSYVDRQGKNSILSTTDYYCNPECFVKAKSDSNE